MSQGGWIKLHRKLLENPIVMKDADHLAVWVYLLLNATSREYETVFGGKPYVLKPGQLITGRKKIEKETLINEHKVNRILKLFKHAQLIEQQTKRYGSVISIVKWHDYQSGEQQVSNKRATSEQQVSTIQEYKNIKNEKKRGDFVPPALADVSKYVEDMGYDIDPAAFYDYYSETNWIRKNGQRIRDWKASVRTWARLEKEFKKSTNDGQKPIEPPKYKEFKKEPDVKGEPMPESVREKMEKFKRGL